MLGGLISDESRNGRSGLPGLSRVPVVGLLFGTNTTVTAKTELLVMITPKVITDQTSARGTTREIRRRLEQVRKLLTPHWAPDLLTQFLPTLSGYLRSR